MIILHISDMHIISGIDIKVLADKIVRVLNVKRNDCHELFIVISGDLSYSGKKSEYEVLKEFFNIFLLKIKETFHVNIFVVPGNHDIDYEKTENNQYTNLNIEAIENYKDFCNAIGADFVDNILIKNVIVDSKKIKVVLINTINGSRLIDNDQGDHEISNELFEKIKTKYEDDVEYSIAIMHHPYYYFNENVLREFQSVICKSIDIVLCGHEHKSEAFNIGNTIKISGDIFSNCNSLNNEINIKGFYILQIDQNNRKLKKEKYLYDDNIFKLQENDVEKLEISKNRICVNKYKLLNDFLNNFFIEKKISFNREVLNYFVFPRLEKIDGKNSKDDIINYEDFEQVVLKEELITIYGAKNSSKTTTLKYIFKKLYDDGKIPIYFDANLSLLSYDDMIRNSFVKQFGIDDVLYNMYQQEEKCNKFLLIDNAEKIDDYILFNIITRSKQDFKCIILSKCKNTLNFDMKLKYSLLEPVEYNITPFYKDKRDKLLELVINSSGKENNNELESISSILDRFKHQYLKQPMYLIMFVKYYEGANDLNDKDVFSKLFEYNISTLINVENYKVTRETIEVILENIAYEIFKKQVLTLHEDVLLSIIKDYLDKAGINNKISSTSIQKILINSGIIINVGCNYCFSESVYQSYFIAKRIYHDYIDDNKEGFDLVIKYLCFNSNLEIAMFVIYLFDNKSILMPIIESLLDSKYIEDFYKNGSVDYLKRKPRVAQTINTVPKRIDIKNEMTKNEEKQYKNEVQLQKKEITKYDNNTILTPVDVVFSLLGRLVLIARSFVTFEHLLYKEEKQNCTKILFYLPLIIFKKWAVIIDRNLNNFINEFERMKKELLDNKINDYEIPESIKMRVLSITNDEYKSMIINSSVNLLLELMNVSMSEATNTNTIDYIDEYFELNTLNEYFKLEHILSLEHRKSITSFIEEIINVGNNNDYIIKQIIQKIASHFISHTKCLSMKQFQTLNVKFFNNKLSYNDYLAINKNIIE